MNKELSTIQPSAWQKLTWRFSPLGRVRLALASVPDATDLQATRTRLRSALDVLRRPAHTANPNAQSLVPLVIENLTDLALRQSDMSDAEDCLGQLDTIHAPAATRLALRWRLIQSLLEDSAWSAALPQARLFVADESCPAAQVTELLQRCLVEAGRPVARQLGQAIAAPLRDDRLVETLRMLCLESAEFVDRQTAADVSGRVQPSLLVSWPVLQCRALVLRAKCAEPMQLWDVMLAETQAALALRPDDDIARYWRARALLHTGRGDDAEEILAEQPNQSNPRWQRLLHIAALCARQELERVEPCLRAVEGEWGKLGQPETSLVLPALQAAVRCTLNDSADRLTAIAAFSERIVHAAGQLPWAAYNLALKEMQVDRAFERAAQRLSGEVAAPPDGWPTHLLQAACATALGHVHELRDALQAAPSDSAADAGDAGLFATVSDVFALLQGNEEIDDAASLYDRLAHASGRLEQAMPTVAGIRQLLLELLAVVTGEGQQRSRSATADDVDGSPWARWLRLRLRLAQDPQTEIACQLSSALDDLPTAVAWEFAAWTQDCVALLPEATTSNVAARVWRPLDNAPMAADATWQQLRTLRDALPPFAEGPGAWGAVGTAGNPSSSPCPWWPLGNVLQSVAQLEARVELEYLGGRHALRRNRVEEALTHFREAFRLCTGRRLATRIAALRFEPVLHYWAGVALAHLQRWDEASDVLDGCLGGHKDAEAKAQLGLIVVGRGDLDLATEYSNQISEPHLPSARYLAALLAERRGDTQAAIQQLDEARNAGSLAGVYSAAAYRLHGVIDEREGRSESASEQYGHALTEWPEDAVAATRLGRIWMRESLEKIRHGHDPDRDPLQDEQWDAVAGQMEAGVLIALRALMLSCGAIGDTASPNRVPSLLISSIRSTALRRLAIRVLLSLGQFEEATEAATTWAPEATGDPHLFAAKLILTAQRDFVASCQTSRSGQARAKMEELVGSFGDARGNLPTDPCLAFWHALARAVLDPSLPARENVFEGGLSDERLAPNRRAIAALFDLFAEDPQRRQDAVDVCRRLATEGAIGNERTSVVVSCLAAYVSGDDNDFLQHYRALERELSSFPCDEATMYLAASEARLRVGAVDEVTGGFIPDTLADLADPDVRRVMGFAYAQQAARQAEKSPRNAIRDLNQALELLEPDDNS